MLYLHTFQYFKSLLLLTHKKVYLKGHFGLHVKGDLGLDANDARFQECLLGLIYPAEATRDQVIFRF